MRNELASVRLRKTTALIVVTLTLATVVVFGQGDGEKTLDDAMQLCRRAEEAYGDGRLEEAIGLSEEALVILQQLGEEATEGVTEGFIGMCYLQLSDFRRAIGYFERAVVIHHRVGDRTREAIGLYSLGKCWSLLAEYQLAIDYHEQAQAIFSAIGDKPREAITLHNLGDCYVQLSDFQKAIDCYEQALPIFSEVGNYETMLEIVVALAECYRSLPDYQRAMDYYEQLLGFAREFGERSLEAVCLGQLGACFIQLSDYDRAIALLNQSLEIALEVEDRVLEAASLINLGICYEYISDFGRSIDCFARSLQIAIEIGDRESEADSRNGLGICYYRLSAYSKAVEYFENALVIRREISDREGEASSLANLGNCHEDLSNYQRALDCWEQSLTIFRETGDKVHESVVLRNLGDLHRILGDVQQAIDCDEQSLLLSREIGDREGEAASLLSLGKHYHVLGDFQRATSFLEQSLALSTELGVVSTQRHSHWGLGLLAREMGDLSGALAHYESAIEIVESIRGTVSEEELRKSYFGSVRTLYEEYLELLLETGRRDETLFVAERLRARTFLDLVAEGPVGPSEDVGEEGIRSGVVEASVIEADLAEVVASLPEHTAAIEYFVTEDTTYLWAIRGGAKSEPIPIDISRSELLDLVLDYRIAIETTSTGLTDPPDEATFTMSRDLYELLITPVEEHLDGIDHLIIVPSGPLYYLPFCALLDCEGCEGPAFFGGEYLVERYAISYTPSLTVLKYVKELAEDVRPDAPFLALADPAAEHPGLQRLPEAQDEAEAAAGLFDQSDVYVDADATEEVVFARASSAGQLLLSTHGLFNPGNPMFSYLLLAPTDDTDGRLYAYEVFGLDLHTDLVTLSACETLLPALDGAEAQVRAVRGAGEEEEVELDERQLEALTAGDEIVGLTRAFICAGAPSVLSTLWKVVSETTKPLMMAFYGYLQEGMPKAQALQQAQLDIAASYRHPRYWAAFSLFGDWGEDPGIADVWLAKLSPELVDAWSAWRSQEHGPDEEPPLIAVVMTMTESMTVDLLGAISDLSEEIAIKGAFGHFVEADVPVTLLPALCGLQQVESVTPPWVTTNSA